MFTAERVADAGAWASGQPPDVVIESLDLGNLAGTF
jgi:hypothetical protein